MRASLLAFTALTATALSSPLPLPSSELDLPLSAPALARRDYDHLSPADVSHFGAVLALQLLGRGALNSTASTGGECAGECGSWLDALSTCPSGPGNDTLAFSCACENEKVQAMRTCAGCLGGEGGLQAEVIAAYCTGNSSLPASFASAAAAAGPSSTYLLSSISTAPSASGAVSSAVHLAASPSPSSSASSFSFSSAAAPSPTASTLASGSPQPTTTTIATSSGTGQAAGGRTGLFVVFAVMAVFFRF